MRRKDALALIRAEVAKHGEATRAAVRAYVETRSVGKAAFDAACAEGLEVFKRLDSRGVREWSYCKRCHTDCPGHCATCELRLDVSAPGCESGHTAEGAIRHG